MEHLYGFTITQSSTRSGERIGETVGVVSAASQEEAETKAWFLAGSDSSFSLDVFEIDPSEGFKFTVYKSEI